METVKVEVDDKGRLMLPLPKEVLRKIESRIGGWVELTLQNESIIVRKAKMVRINVKLSEEIKFAVQKYSEKEGYGSDEEAITNLITQALVEHFAKSKDEKLQKLAEKLQNKWYLKIH